MIDVRNFRLEDWSAVWTMLEPVFRAGETYVFPQDISEEDARRVWTEFPATAYVAVIDEEVVGTYYIKPNQPARGSHVCNCGYIVSSTASGKGVASQMCLHSQEEAKRMGFRAMQFNFVVATNDGAIRLWQKLGFEIVGRLPEAFQHPVHSYVDALVMHKRLNSD